MQITDATARDVADITALYNHSVQHSTANWTTELADEADRATWIAERQAAGLPVLVARDEAFLGYASYGSFRAKDGFRMTVEHSVYVVEGQQRRGIARALMEELIARARAARLHVMIGAIESQNMASLRLHEALGFVETGRMPQVGEKFGRWLDLSLLQLVLDDDGPDGR